MISSLLFGSLLLGPVWSTRIVPGVSLGNLRIGDRTSAIEKLGVPYAGDAAMGKSWSTWLGKGEARLDVFRSRAVDEPVVRIIRATSPQFRTASGLGPGVAESRMRRAFPRARSVGTYRPPSGGPPIHVFDDVSGGLAFELLRGRVIAVAVHAKGRGVEGDGLRIYLGQPLRRIRKL